MNTAYKWLLLIFLFAAPAYSQNARVDNVTFSSVQGFPFLPGATITICTAAATGLPCSPTVPGTCLSISDTICNQSATLTSDALGNYGFWIQPGSYSYTVTKAGFGGFGPKPLTLACQPTASCTTTGPQSFTNLNNFRFASQFAGADCGAKINAADVNLGTLPGTIIVDSGCGLVWTTLVSIGTYHTLSLMNSGLGVASSYTTSAGVSLDGQGATLTCWMGGTDNCSLQEAAGANLPFLVRMNTGNFNWITWVTLDGNKANNPTGGVVVLNKGQNSRILYSVIQNAATHGMWVQSTNNQTVAGIYQGNTFATNGADGVFAQLTADNFMHMNQDDVNGSTGTVNTQNAATGGCSANCVTWVSGSKWSTDTSLASNNIYIRINGTQFQIASIQSTTVLTLTSAPGTLNGVTYGIGAALELQNSPTWRILHNDFGQNQTGGILIYGTAGALQQCWQNIIGPGNQFGNALAHDIEIHGFDTVGSAVTCIQQHIEGNEFIGSFATGASTASDHIKCFDCSGGLITGNMFNGHISPNQQRAAMEFTETASGRAGQVEIAGNSFQDNAYTVGRYIDSTANGTTRQQIPVSSLAAGATVCLDILDTNSADASPHTYFCKATNGDFFFRNSAGTTTFYNGINGQVTLPIPGSTLSMAGASSGTATLAPSATGVAFTGPQFISSGSACTNGELALSAGWQSTGSATVTAVTGLGQTCSWTITTGTTTAANPTVTDTLTNILPAATTVCEMNIHGGSHTAAAGEGFQQTTLSATAPIFTFNGTPTAGGTTYFVTRRCGP